MIQSKKKWIIERPDEKLVQTIMERCQLPAIHAKILASRSFESVDAICDFLSIDQQQPHDPYSMYGMEQAVQMIDEAIDTGQHITVYGDYDADGVTSTSLIYRTLKEMGARVDYAIPNRFIHGYGPNIALFDELIDAGTQLIITVDNGISAVEAIQHARDRGCDVILTDHHEIGETLPNANVILHPRHPEGNYPFGELAGVGVALKLSQALIQDSLEPFLAYAAIGTVADLVPLIDENRWIVRKGLEALRKGVLPAANAFCEVNELRISDFNEETIGFQFGPQLNAPGRLQEATIAVQALIAETEEEARVSIEKMKQMNEERKELVNQAVQEAIQIVAQQPLGSSIVVAKEGWNPGIVGIVASRLVEEFHRPTIVLGIDREKQIAKGSARSIEHFHLYDTLAEMSDVIEQFGGHEMAAGMTIALDQFETFQIRFEERATQKLTEDDFIPKELVDVPVTLNEITVEHLEGLEQLRPFGMNFERPVYLIEDVKVQNVRQIGQDKSHLKFQIVDGNETLDVIGFREGCRALEMTEDITYSFIGELDVNEWNGNKNPQLILRDVRSDDWQLFDVRGIRKVDRWASTVPENAHWVAFREETMPVWKPNLAKTTYVEELDIEKAKNEPLVLIDLPQTKEQLSTLIKMLQPSRIYAHFYMPHSLYYEGMPSREQFSQLYLTLKRRNPFSLTRDKRVVLHHFKWKEERFDFMLQVFFDLQFVTIEGDLVQLQEVKQKQALTKAPTYAKREQTIALEEALVYSPSTELKNWLSIQYDNGKEDE